MSKDIDRKTGYVEEKVTIQNNRYLDYTQLSPSLSEPGEPCTAQPDQTNNKRMRTSKKVFALEELFVNQSKSIAVLAK